MKAVVLSVDLERRRISFGLKPSYFTEIDFASAGESDEEAEEEELGVVDDDDVEIEGEKNQDSAEERSEDDSEDENQDSMQVDVDVEVRSGLTERVPHQRVASTPTLQLGGGFQWSAQTQQEDDISASSGGEDEEEANPGKKKKHRRKAIEQDLTADLQTKTPESNADFERLLLGSPNSSYLWVQYMSFQLQLSEVDKARDIARRALKTINFREEKEKLNVWIALLNIENVYGTEESLESTFKDAARHNDSKTIHLRLAAILDQSDKIEVSL